MSLRWKGWIISLVPRSTDPEDTFADALLGLRITTLVYSEAGLMLWFPLWLQVVGG